MGTMTGPVRQVRSVKTTSACVHQTAKARRVETMVVAVCVESVHKGKAATPETGSARIPAAVKERSAVMTGAVAFAVPAAVLEKAARMMDNVSPVPAATPMRLLAATFPRLRSVCVTPIRTVVTRTEAGTPSVFLLRR